VELEQKTVNLIIVIAAVVVAAGAWSAPLMTAQTTHNLISAGLGDLSLAIDDVDLNVDNAVIEVNQNTDAETGEVSSGFFGSGTDLKDAYGDCTLMDLMISVALDEPVQQLCDPGDITDFIEGDIHFADFKDQVEFGEQFLEVLPMKLLPDRDCTGTVLTDVQTFANQDNLNNDVLISSTGIAGQFGTAVCIQQLSFEDPPLRVKAVTLEDNAQLGINNVRLQLALINSIDAGSACGNAAFFSNNVVFDGMFTFDAQSKSSMSGDLMIVLPPDGNSNICARVSSGTINGGEDYQVWLTAQEVLPLNIINFAPPPDFAFFEFEHFAPIL